MSRDTYDVKETYTGNGSLSAYTFDFKITDKSQLLIIEVNDSGVETQRVLGTDTTYLSSVTFDEVDGGGTVNLAANLTTAYELIILLADDAPTQSFQFRNKTSFTLRRFENALDAIAGAVQRLTYRGKQAFRIHDLDDEETFNAQLPPGVATSQNRSIIVNNAGTGMEYGPTSDQITNAQGYSETAENHKDTAELWANRTAGTVVDQETSVDSGEYSSKAYAIGGTGVTETANKGASKEWATKTDNPVDTSEYSSKEYAVGVQRRGAASGGSAKDWATYIGGTVDDAEFSAKKYAQDAAASAASINRQTFANQAISGAGNINHTNDNVQYRRVSGNGGAVTTATTPFGTDATNFVDGMEITLVGTNANAVTVPVTDIAWGVQSPTGPAILTENFSVTYICDTVAQRFIEKCRNS